MCLFCNFYAVSECACIPCNLLLGKVHNGLEWASDFTSNIQQVITVLLTRQLLSCCTIYFTINKSTYQLLFQQYHFFFKL